MADFWVLILAGALSSAAPLILAGLGEVFLERSGAGFNLGIEGILLCGALAGVFGATLAGPWAGAGFGLATGMAFGLLYALATAAGIDTVLAGITLSLLGAGLCTYAFQVFSPPGHTNVSVATLPGLTAPGLGPVFRNVGVATYVALLLVAVASWVLRKTRFGLRLRACGDDEDVARLRGISVRGHRSAAALIAGGAAGLAGAVLSLAAIGSFTPMMTGGRGFIVLAVVIIARRTPVGVLFGALLFAAFDSLALLAQTRDLGLPREAYQALPYVVTLAVLCLHTRRSSPQPTARSAP